MEHGGGGHEVVAVLTPGILLLGLGLVAALASNAVRLSPIVGYIVLGGLLSAFGMAGAFEGPVVDALAEAGVMFLLFNLGLHFSLSRIRAEAGAIFGFGALQMLVAGGGFTALLLLLGFATQAAVLAGFALGLSSTAVVIGLLRERDQEDCPVGRAAQAILIFQDIAAIALLVAAGVLASGEGAGLGAALAAAAAKALAAFAAAVLFARYLTRPLFALVTRTRMGEVYTATALFLALAAGWATGMMGLSLTLGAFLGGVAIADSPYRVLVQTEIEAFRGLFLGFFFMTVGLSLDMAVIVAEWPLVLGAAAGLIAVKCALNIGAALVNRWSVPGSVQLGFLLGQGSEFALVLFAIPSVALALGSKATAILVAAIAISLATTPLVSNLGRRWAGKLRTGPADRKLPGDDAKVVVYGLTDTGRALADALDERGVPYLAIEPDRERFELALADGYTVTHADGGDPRSWEALNMARREVIALTFTEPQRLKELAPLVANRFPGLTRIVALHDEENRDAVQASGSHMVAMGEGGHDRLVDAVIEHAGGT